MRGLSIHFAAVLTVTLAGSGLRGAGNEEEPPSSPVTEAQVAVALATYEKEPLGEKGTWAVEVITAYAEQHPEKIKVYFYEDAVPWMISDLAGSPTPELMGAFVMGNVKAQLRLGQPVNNSYAGTLEVIRVYELLQKKEPAVKIPEVERFRDMEKGGALKKFMDDVDARYRAREEQNRMEGEALPSA
jgi:hypothetical protein